jgi:serine/threonine protein kinase
MPRTCLTCGLETEDEIDVCPDDGTPLKNKNRDPFIGTLFLNKYEITHLLGRGGMSAVYKGRQMLMDRLVAIKVLRTELVQDQLSLKRFQQESKAASMLSHPNVIGVHDFDVTGDGVPYLIMDFVDGNPISTILRREGQMLPARCVNLFSQACNALAHAHSKGVVHRDIKPSNLMVVVDENDVEMIKLVDFGIAKLIEFDRAKPRLTMTGEIFGSPTYMSPEQCGGKSIDARSDIYSLGCVIYECLTGVAPIKGETLLETIYKHVNEPAPPFKQVRPDLDYIPAALEEAVLKSLEKAPEQRYQTMTEFENALKSYDRDSSLPAGSKSSMAVLGAGTERGARAGAPNAVSYTGQVTDRSFSCSACSKANPIGLVYCQYCGEKAKDSDRVLANGKRPCSKCGSTDVLSSHFCTECGTSLSLQSKAPVRGLQAAILVAAAVGIIGGGSWYVWRSHLTKPKEPVTEETVVPEKTENPFSETEKNSDQRQEDSKETQQTPIETNDAPKEADDSSVQTKETPKEAQETSVEPKETAQETQKPAVETKQTAVATIEDATKKGTTQATAAASGPWLKVHTWLIGKKKWTEITDRNYEFHDLDGIVYTVQPLAMPQNCVIYVLHKDIAAAEVIFSAQLQKNAKPMPCGKIKYDKGKRLIEPFVLRNGPITDKLIVIASPHPLLLDRNNTNPVFLKALSLTENSPDGVVVTEKDLGLGNDISQSIFLTYLTTWHTIAK